MDDRNEVLTSLENILVLHPFNRKFHLSISYGKAEKSSASILICVFAWKKLSAIFNLVIQVIDWANVCV